MFTLALPIAMQNLLSVTASMIDTIMIGSQGELAVAAIGICSQIGSLFFNLYWGFASTSILFFSQYWGARDEDGINRTFGLVFLCFAAIGCTFAGLCITHPSLLLSIYTDKENLVLIGTPYMRIVGWAYIFQIFSTLIMLLLRATERVRGPLICSIISVIVNFVANWTLIYGRFGFPKMGASGAAVGTLLSGMVNFILLLIILLRSECEIRIQFGKLFLLPGSFVGTYFKKALPIVANEMLYGIGQMIINIVIGHQDEAAIAAMAAFRVCEGFVYAFFGGLSNATSVIVGKEIGAGRLEQGHQYAKRSSLFCPLVTFVVVLICVICNQPLFELFGLGSQALHYGKYMLLIYLFFGSIRTSNYIMNETFRAGGESVFGTVVEVIGLYALSIPLTWLAGMYWKLPFLLVFAFVYTDEFVRFFILLPYTFAGKWIKPVTEQGKAALDDFRARHIHKKHGSRMK